MRFCGIAVIMVLALTAQARVFSLWPRTSGGGASDNPLEAREFSKEPVIINGVKLEMSLGLINMHQNDIIISIQQQFKNAKVAGGGANLLIMCPEEDGWQQRYLLIKIREGLPVLQIAMRVPTKLPDKFDWPRQLPILPNAKPFRVMSFPQRNALYGAFTYDHFTTAEALDRISGTLNSEEWVPIGKEQANYGAASGEIFLRKSPSSVMLVNFTQEGIGFVYTRPMK